MDNQIMDLAKPILEEAKKTEGIICDLIQELKSKHPSIFFVDIKTGKDGRPILYTVINNDILIQSGEPVPGIP